jgi:hypothetical protein
VPDPAVRLLHPYYRARTRPTRKCPACENGAKRGKFQLDTRRGAEVVVWTLGGVRAGYVANARIQHPFVKFAKGDKRGMFCEKRCAFTVLYSSDTIEEYIE